MGAVTAFRVLTVCTGNICRSPAAQFMLADEFGRRGAGEEIIVASAGTRPLEGYPVEPAMGRLLEAAGIDVSEFAARRLDRHLVQDADLVLGLTRGHRARVVEMDPGALKRTYTLRELARLAEQVDPDELDRVAGADADLQQRFRLLLAIVPRYKTPVPPAGDDVEDPYKREDEVFAAVHDQMKKAIRSLARVILPPRS